MASIKNQNRQNYELVYVIERNEKLAELVAHESKKFGLGVAVISKEGVMGLAESRNLGARSATGDLVAFVDDDVILAPNWSEMVEDAFRIYGNAAGMTGPAYPVWVGPPATWLPKELDWLIGCTEWFSSDRVTEIGNCWGMNMVFRRSAFERVGGFSTNTQESSRYLRHGFSQVNESDSLTRKGRMAEDLDISLRIRKAAIGVILYNPGMVVYNKVHRYRLSSRYIIERASWIAFSRRNASRYASMSGLAKSHLEPGLSVRILFSLVDLRRVSLGRSGDLAKRFKTVLLLLVSMLIGYLFGPIQ